MTAGTPAFSPVRDIRTAMSFLTRIPVGWISGLTAGDLAAAAWAFPLIGAVVGGLAGAALYGAALVQLHPLAGALIGLGVLVLLTGALHEDGLADVADGLGASDRMRRLDIMRDSRIGSYGVLALVFSVGLRAALLAGMAGPGAAWLAMIAAGAASRALLPAVMRVLPPARPDGLSKDAGMPGGGVTLAAAGLGALALFAALPLAPALSALLLAALLAAGVAWWAKSRLGGHTGDVLGALQQIIETAVLLCAAGWSAEL